MSDTATLHGPQVIGADEATEPVAIPVREIVPWAIFVGVLAFVLLYIVGGEQGATSLIGGHFVHEWVHDARHLLGFPCH